jgi:uncharacterized membrane protein YvbJ
LAGKVTFYCESCGKKVHHRDNICPHCGKFFSKVKCPVCGMTGTSEQFLQGCPQCGYMAEKPFDLENSEYFETAYIEQIDRSSRKKPMVKPTISLGTLLALVASIGFLVMAFTFWVLQ